MNRKGVAVVLVLIIVGAGTFFVLYPPYSDSYHFEVSIPEGGYTRVSLHLDNIQDCALNVSFIDDPSLLYRIDASLYESVSQPSAFDLTINDLGENSHLLQVWFEGKVRIKILRITLGSGVPYGIGVLGSNVNVTILYGNNAVGSDADFVYSTTGSFVSLIFTEDMVFSDTGMEVICGADHQPDYIYLYANLPEGVNGEATFRNPLYLQANTGWVYRSQFFDEVTYSTDTLNTEPLLELRIKAKYGIYAWLFD